MTFADAEKWCKTNFTHLVTIQNKEEIEFLNERFPENQGHYWIGIRKIGNEWRWLGTSKKLTEEAENWAEGEPNNIKNNEDCVEMYIKRKEDAGKWNDEPCDKKKAALCYTASCEPHPCSGHGECVETINNYTCHCDRGFYGRDCEHVMTCDLLTEPAHGKLDCNHPVKDFSYNSSCQVQCTEGYKSTGMDPVWCTEFGNWSAPIPECKVVECGTLQTPVDGFLNCSSPPGHFAWNSSCEFACREGFLLKGSRRLQCGASGEWDREKPECEAVHCGILKAPENGFLNCSNSDDYFAYNTICEVSCMERRVLKGFHLLKCLASGNWTATVPTCEAPQAGWDFVSYLSIGATASFLSVGSFLIWLIKRLRRKAKFSPASCQNLDS
ncbi:E-selectin-like [Hemicordylus capensis]|uniref:E-selectin-like n=1 Tax=Hemicordylus capensis TaxID=884348 RepID=UPI0023020BCC|nr:E-selectin-like [Hemicordylus capensis]